MVQSLFLLKMDTQRNNLIGSPWKYKEGVGGEMAGGLLSPSRSEKRAKKKRERFFFAVVVSSILEKGPILDGRFRTQKQNVPVFRDVPRFLNLPIGVDHPERITGFPDFGGNCVIGA